ncbi:Sulfhydryl oxidase 2 [Thelohanellus kitauei]|uniref:Sulfhydryl oxidase n=1 Tax=Thelohanellus kitauei TaxID=669202 RepID=A0A0C2MPD3_THEKT|nr:Sulfhydryl oxidase 2 [Thelohanellus kitauei]
MRGYIINFFGCHACREHFKELTRHAEEQVKTGEDAILYLWNGHNRVNSRLRLDDSADPMAPKIQFPSPELCPDCREIANLPPSEVFISTPGYDIPAISWNRGNVIKFLRNHYGPNNIRLPGTKTPTTNEDLHDISEEFAGSLDKGRKRNLIIKHML